MPVSATSKACSIAHPTVMTARRYATSPVHLRGDRSSFTAAPDVASPSTTSAQQPYRRSPVRQGHLVRAREGSDAGRTDRQQRGTTGTSP